MTLRLSKSFGAPGDSYFEMLSHEKASDLNSWTLSELIAAINTEFLVNGFKNEYEIIEVTKNGSGLLLVKGHITFENWRNRIINGKRV